MPGSLEKRSTALEKDHEFLLKGDVFTEDLLETWIDYKRKNEVERHAPAPASVRVPPVLRHLGNRCQLPVVSCRRNLRNMKLNAPFKRELERGFSL